MKLKTKMIIGATAFTIFGASLSAGVFAALKTTLVVNGKTSNAEVQIINGSSYVPLKSVAQLLGATVQYDNNTKTITITSGSGSTAAEQPTTSSPAPAAATQTQATRSKPAALGTKVSFTAEGIDDTYSGSITVNSIIRGEEAWNMLLAENQFNDPAPEGYEYMIANITVGVSGNENADAAVNIDYLDFTAISSGSSDYDFVSAVTPDPLQETLYVGASATGNATFLVKSDDANPLIMFGRKYDGTGGYFFKTN